EYAIVITGSSLAARVPTEDLPEGFYNLAMVGDGALTGLEIVARSPAAAPLVLIEVNNSLFREVDQALLERTFRPINVQLRAWFPAFGDTYQPVGIACRIIRARLGFGESGSDMELPPKVYDEVFGLQQRYHDRVPRPKELTAMLDPLEAAVQRVQARGTRVAFFEVPMAPALDDSPMSTTIRGALAQRFPPQRYSWLPRADARLYETRDGRHLRSASARQFAAFLCREASRVMSMGAGQGGA
ncbi:MAG: hypothetical protein ACRDL7_11490, partial [Gaiellaceae bacterium]